MIPASVFAPATLARPIAETRLLVVHASTGDMTETQQSELATFFGEGDVIVVNDAATLPASVFGEVARTGEVIELRLLALPRADGACEAAVLGAGDWLTPTERRAPPPPLAPGDDLVVAGLEVTVLEARSRRARLRFSGHRDDVVARLYRAGKPVQYAHIRAPFPLWDVQNAYAAEPWAAEMPSAGRPIDFAMLDALRKRGASVARLTHGAGLSSIGGPDLDATLPWRERYRIPEETAALVARAKHEGRRVIAVGTSVVRALESSARSGPVHAEETTTDLRIDARHRLRAASGLLTGMHDAATSHADLLSAFITPALLAEASAWAASRGFLGHELGDSCLILDA